MGGYCSANTFYVPQRPVNGYSWRIGKQKKLANIQDLSLPKRRTRCVPSCMWMLDQRCALRWYCGSFQNWIWIFHIQLSFECPTEIFPFDYNNWIKFIGEYLNKDLPYVKLENGLPDIFAKLFPRQRLRGHESKLRHFLLLKINRQWNIYNFIYS